MENANFNLLFVDDCVVFRQEYFSELGVFLKRMSTVNEKFKGGLIAQRFGYRGTFYREFSDKFSSGLFHNCENSFQKPLKLKI